MSTDAQVKYWLNRIGLFFWNPLALGIFAIVAVFGGLVAMVVVQQANQKPSTTITCDHGQHIAKHRLDKNTIEVVCVTRPKGKP